MLPWYALGSGTQMANNLIKWWRSKFLNGYKQFSAMPECDTEQLLAPSCADGDDGPPQDAGHDAAPPERPTSRRQEFSCDVSMEGEIDRDGQERQEFSFTLYDFDGHGKITKDDIAGLVTTIYETLGSSIKVPHYGSKTIKVKLTVSPDQRKHMSATIIDQKVANNEENGNEPPKPNIHAKNDAKKTLKDYHPHRRRCRKKPPAEEKYCCNFTCRETNDVFDLSDGEQCSRVSEEEISEDEGECSEDYAPKHRSCEKYKSKHYQKHVHTNRRGNANDGSPNGHAALSPVLCKKTVKNRKRSSSLQRQELLEIIQANMDKNNLSFQTSRGKQCQNHISAENEHYPTSDKQHRNKQRATRESFAQLQCLANMVNSNNYYIDIGSLPSNNQVPPSSAFLQKKIPYCRYDNLLGAVVCMSNKQIGTNLQRSSTHATCRSKQHNRSRPNNNPIPFRYHLLEPHGSNKHTHIINGIMENFSTKTIKKTNGRPKSYETEMEQTPAGFKKNVKKFPQVVLGHSSSPHHLKHRNRQEDQARAMAQVVRWLEQEFSSNVNVKSKNQENQKKNDEGQSFPHATHTPPSNKTPSPSISSSVERHEHHHVHEHIHHHYHHYQEAPIVV